VKIKKISKKIITLLAAIILYSFAIVLTIHSQLGASPWDVFHLGVVNHSSLTLGQVSQLTGLAIIIAGILLGEIPGFGSLMNMYFIGYFVDIIRKYNLVPYGNQLWQQFLMLILGIYLIGWATYFYLGVGMGSGPRDSLMVGLIKKFNASVWLIRAIIEGTALVIGYLLGGLVGIGTIIMTFFIGFAIQHVFKIMKKSPADIQHTTLLDIYNILKEKPFKKEIEKEKG
jgi:uncharacterized membrane protein YczE